jgi:hypothetical protein
MLTVSLTGTVFPDKPNNKEFPKQLKTSDVKERNILFCYKYPSNNHAFKV